MRDFKTIASYVISGGIGGLAAILTLHYLAPVPSAANPARSPTPVARATVDGDLRKVQISRSEDLSFKVPASINGRNVEMLVDTGANITVLSRDDAMIAGLYRAEATGHIDAVGINNQLARYRRVGERTVQIGPISLVSVPIAIDESGELGTSILGQDAFCNLRRITIENNELELLHDSDISIGCIT